MTTTITANHTPRFRDIRHGLALMASALAIVMISACSSTTHPAPAVTTPDVGRPPMAASIDAAIAQQAFTPYAELGIASNDGLDLNEADGNLATACMTDAGYPTSGAAVPAGRLLGDSLTGTTPFGAYGYVGGPAAARNGFFPNTRPPSAIALASLPAAAQAAAFTCSQIIGDFQNTQASTSMATVTALGTQIRNATSKDPSVIAATAAWSTCMTRNGYQYTDPDAILRAKAHIQLPDSQTTISASPADIALAVADATCTRESDLDGIYFAVQAAYEQQIVNTNQQKLAAAVQQYRAAYQQELTHLPTLLTTTKPPPTETDRPGRIGSGLSRPQHEIRAVRAAPTRATRSAGAVCCDAGNRATTASEPVRRAVMRPPKECRCHRSQPPTRAPDGSTVLEPPTQRDLSRPSAHRFGSRQATGERHAPN